MQRAFVERRLIAWAWATTFARALWGSTFFHVTALAALVLWASAARQIPGGGGRGGMSLELSAGDGAPRGPLPLELLGDPNSPPEITPWAKNVASSESGVVAPPPLTEVVAPAGTKEKPPVPDNSSAADAKPAPTELLDAKPSTSSVTESNEQPSDSNTEPREQSVQLGPRMKAATELLAEKPPKISVTAATPSAAPSSTSNHPAPASHTGSSASASVASGGGSPAFVGNIPPRYPELAVENRWEGDVMLLLHIDTKGRVFKVEVLHGSGHVILDDEAAAAIRHWVGQPAKRDGMPVESTAQLPVHFRLK